MVNKENHLTSRLTNLFGAQGAKLSRCDLCNHIKRDCVEHELGFMYCLDCRDKHLIEELFREKKPMPKSSP